MEVHVSFETSGYDYHAVVSSVVALHRKADSKWRKCFKEQNPKGTGEEFDVMEYFKVLKHISPPDGQILDYVCWQDRWGGEPILYLRERTEPPFRTLEEYSKKERNEEEGNLPTLLRLDQTPESFFELVVFKVLAGQFYLAWHANYNDTQVITLRSDVEEILEGLPSSRKDQKLRQERMRNTDISPCVKLVDHDTVSVSVVLFSNWGGFWRATEKISRNYPHIFRAADGQVLLEYDCGILF
jgi:hypothetical protein